MWHLTRLALRNRLVTLLIVIMLTGASIWAVFTLKMELIPNIEFPYATVITVYPGASPDEVAEKVSVPIEDAIWQRWNGKGLKHTYSVSSDSISVVFGEFEFGTSMGRVTETTREDVGNLDLPSEVLAYPQMNPALEENPRIVPFNTSLMPMVVLGLTGDVPPDQLKEIADTQIVPALQGIEGVHSVEIEGGEQDQVVISPDPAKMNEYGISMSQIASLLASEYDSLNAIENTPLGTDSVVLGDVASVDQGPAPLAVVARTNGKPSVAITVLKEEDANTVDVANAVMEKAAGLEDSLGNGVKLTSIFDQSEFIESSISQLWEKALIGCALAIVVVFLFLTAIRASLVTAISIPLSVLIGFLLMSLFHLTINLLTLSAMTIAVGRLIDDSIVMVEIIYRRLRQGEGFKEAAINGSREVGGAITSATLATVAIFLPLMFVGGIVGELFIPFALTITFAMMASLVVALMVVPALSNFIVGERSRAKTGDAWYLKIYTPTLRWALGHRALTLVIAGVLFIGSLGLMPIVGTSFMHGMSEKALFVDIQLPPGTGLTVTSDTAAQVEALLEGNPEIRDFYTTVGTSTSLMGAMTAASGGGDNTATITAYLDPGADMDKEAEELRLACEAIPGSEGIAVSTSESSSGNEMGFSGLEVSIQGNSYDDLAATSSELLTRLEGVSGLANLEGDITTVVPNLDIELDPAKVSALGLPVEQVQQELYLLMMGSDVPGTVANIGEGSYAVFINGVSSGLEGPEEAETLRIGWPQSVSLGDVATVALEERPTHISHTDLELSATVRGAITDKNVGAVNMAVQKEIDSLTPRPGVEVKMTGVAEMMAETFSRMGIAILAAIVISYLVVVVTMRSFINPLIIMLSLPLATIGAVPALLVSGHTMGVSAMMGMLMLVGIVLTNAIVLIVLVEQLRKNGMSTYDALMQGGQTRLRPILMTALTTIIAMVPLSLGVGSGELIAAELAVVVIGGLFSSTLLTLVVIPVVYSLIQGRRRRGTKAA